ncbi:hypothetical protein C0J52_19619 [Blattella germanica]|nr:hypothetical protein C0J52_19619 [Blattella germanica]
MVDTIFHLFEFLDHSEDEGVAFRFLLKACKDQQLFINKASSGIHLVLPIINSKLNSSASRFKGLLLLKTLLPQFPADVIEENAVSWMQQCLKPTEAGENKQEVLDTTYQVLYTLLEMSEKFPEMRRPVSANIVPKIIENFQKISLDEPSLSALKCIELLMMKYGPSCGQQKNALEKCLFQYIDCQDSCISDRLARCVANLPLLGGGGSLGANHVNRWTQDHQKLCATLHDILDQLFCDIREIPQKHIDMKCIFSSSEFPLDKALDLSAIMGIACRALAVNSRTIGKKVSNDITLTSVLLPEIHVAVFDLINSLITCCRDVLVTYDSIICQLVLQTLKWTSNKNWVCGVRKPYG